MKKLATTLLTAALVGVGGAAWAATITGTPAADHLTGTPAADTIEAKGGNDTVMARAGDDLVLAGAGADVVNGQKGSDEIRGEAGPDKLDAGRDAVRDYVIGGLGKDRIFVWGGDWAFGNGGNDHIWLTYPDAAAKVNCGNGYDTLILNQDSPTPTILNCEVVKIVSAG